MTEEYIRLLIYQAIRESIARQNASTIDWSMRDLATDIYAALDIAILQPYVEEIQSLRDWRGDVIAALGNEAGTHYEDVEGHIIDMRRHLHELRRRVRDAEIPF